MLKTKKMMEDIKKLNPSDLYVCNYCGDDNVEEKAWISVNNAAVIKGKAYHEVHNCCDDMYWCRSCNVACKPITFDKYMEEKDE